MRTFELEKTTKIAKNNSYILSYPSMINFFKSKDTLTENDVIVGMHMVYGWMPTILTVHETISIKEATELFNYFREIELGEDESFRTLPGVYEKLELLKSKFNNSIIGVSKFLHFLRPDCYPIYDSKLHRYNKGIGNLSYNSNNVNNYLGVVKIMNYLMSQQEINPFHKSMQNKIGYKVSKIRAIELVMFLNSEGV